MPVIHTREDLGSLALAVNEISLMEIGAQRLEQNARTIDAVWRCIEETIDAMGPDLGTYKLYQDGLPVCGQELKIVSDLAHSGSRNHRLLMRLMEKGATIVGTESASLLMQEYRLIVLALEAWKQGSADAPASDCDMRFSELLVDRDRAIAARINDTLMRGETGLLFLGMLHNVEKWLDCDIRIVRPFSFQSAMESQAND